MGSAALEALSLLFSMQMLPFMLIGVALGLVVGLLPGLGGVAGMAVVLPFIYGMDPVVAVALMVGMMAVTQTSDTFVSVLLGVPGSSSSQATILDGYPMAQRGEAGRALGAAFFASAVGGVFGAIVLFSVLPFARPLILALRTPELFMMVLFGLSLVGVLVRGVPLTGVTAAMLGLFLSGVGAAPATAELRFTFGQIYLHGGIKLMILALGLFAIPEMVDLLRKGVPIAGKAAEVRGGVLDGVKDALKHKRLIAGSSAVGVVVGIIPGLGGSVVDWIAYGLAGKWLKNTENFGKGDIRGVIAPESANNAKEGGTMIPILLFGVPGSGSTAMLLGALILIGVQPGPSLLQDTNISLIFIVVWSLVVANIIATGTCMALTKHMVKVSLIPPKKLVPFLIVIITVASYQASHSWGDVVTLMLIGTLGWILKQAGWPRPPVLVGFVLGPAAERYLSISMSRYGFEWLTRPGVIFFGILTIASILYGFKRSASLDDAIGEKVTSGEGKNV